MTDNTAKPATLDAAMRALLPPKLLEIAEVIGLEAALKLCETWPGIRITVPKTVEASHPLAVALGVRPARALSKVYGGESIVPPICARFHREQMRARMLEEYRAGTSAAVLARKYGVHQFSIYNLAARDAAARQGSLLD